MQGQALRSGRPSLPAHEAGLSGPRVERTIDRRQTSLQRRWAGRHCACVGATQGGPPAQGSPRGLLPRRAGARTGGMPGGGGGGASGVWRERGPAGRHGHGRPIGLQVPRAGHPRVGPAGCRCAWVGGSAGLERGRGGGGCGGAGDVNATPSWGHPPRERGGRRGEGGWDGMGVCPTPARHTSGPMMCISRPCRRLPRIGLGATQTTTQGRRGRGGGGGRRSEANRRRLKGNRRRQPTAL